MFLKYLPQDDDLYGLYMWIMLDASQYLLNVIYLSVDR